MKLLLILGSDDIYNRIAYLVKPLGFELIRYNHVLKAMDNIAEIDPQAVVINALDFPRHWKTIVQFVRNERPKEVCPIIVLRGENFPLEEFSKASFLGVSGVLAETLNNPAEVDKFKNILSRYTSVDERRQTRRFHIESWFRFGFVFIHPQANILITGDLEDVSSGGLSFLPDNPSSVKDIKPHTDLPECSLRAGDSILSPVCTITRTGRIISVEFLSFPGTEWSIFNKYIETLSSTPVQSGQKILLGAT